jgi:predicted ATPase
VGSEPWPGGVDVRVRIGLHTGETEEHAMGFFGPAVHVAARIAAAGYGGQILASAVTGSLLDRADLRDLGSIRLDDYAVAEQRVFQVGEGEYPPIGMAGGRPGNLPTRMGRVIGREQELTVIGEALSRYPVVTLVGPGGIGKTRLALMAARIAARTRGWGAWLIELAGLTSSDDVPRAVADTLGVMAQPGRTLTRSIVTVLQSRPALLIIDNCEHVIDGAARLAQAIAEDCPNVRMFATSRERLHIAHEQLVAVGPLDPAGAGVELFHARALAVDLAFDLDAHRDDVEEICRRLDGIPLAIELAAARTRSLAPPELVSRLDDRLRLMTGGGRSNAERHRTLRATFQWSYDLLTPPEQTMLARLSIFAGPFDLAAAENVVADAVLDVVAVDVLLSDLVERSMLIAEVSPFGQRFRLLETVRQFAAEHLRERGHADRLVERHASWCLDRVTDIHRLLIGAGEIEGVARLAALWPNLRSAVDRACSTRDAALADALIRPVATEIALRGRHEIADWAERILALTPTPAEDVLVFWLIWIAERYQQNGDHAGYERLVRRYGEPDRPLVRYARAYLSGEGEALRQCLPGAVAQLSTHGDDYMAAFIQAMAAGSLLGIARFQEVDASISELADRYRAHGPPTLLHWTLQTLGYSASFQGRHAAADKFFDEAADVEIPDRTLSANKLLEARSAFQHGQRARAFQILRLYMDDLIETGNLIAASVVCIEFVNMMAAIDRLAEAAHMLGYLETINDFGALASRTLVADAARKVTTSAANIPKPPQPGGYHLDDRRALAYMRDVLADLEQRGIRSRDL